MIPQRNSVPNDELLPGSTLGKYEILRKLATGGMAEIYLARSRGVAGFEKTVVLKRILPHVAEDEAFVQMFLDEARLAATLQHTNIADVYDVGEVEGTPFFTMEYVHGQDVRAIRAATRKRDEQVPIAMALAIIHGTAAALDYAHARTGADGRPLELVHRDVSSSNIIVSYDGAIKLLDFGIARAASHQHKTQIGTLKGKTPYMSPEQCRAQRLDRRSDLFSLGTVMFELTVGRRPFRGENDFAVMEQIVHGEAPLPSSLVPGYPADLEAIVMRLLARDLGARYQTAEEVLHELERFISQHGLWVSARPLGKYMRLLFADRIEAWERAANEGVTLSEHVAETITSESQRAELITPQSGYPPRLLRLSQEIPAVGMPSQQMDAVQPPFDEPPPSPMRAVIAASDIAPPHRASSAPIFPPHRASSASIFPPHRASSAALIDPDPEVPELRSSRRVFALLTPVMIAIVIAGVIYAWPTMFPKQTRAASPAEPAPEVQPAPGGEPAAAQATAAEPVQPARPPAAPAPMPDEPTPDEPTPTSSEPAQPGQPSVASSRPSAAPSRPSAAPSRPSAAPSRPSAAPVRRPAVKRVPPKPPAKAPPRVPSSKQPEGDAWDRDSPFLPPSS
jgi:serine/threonine protein kinase